MKSQVDDLFCKRKDLPHDIQWGDIVDVTIEEIKDFGVFFSYKGVRGFIDWIRLPQKEDYKRFTEGLIKVRDLYKLRLGIVNNQNGTVQLISRPDIVETELLKEKYKEFRDILNLMEDCVLKGCFFDEKNGSNGLTRYGIISDKLSTKTGDLECRIWRIFECSCTSNEKEFIRMMFAKYNYKYFDIPVVITGFDDQLLNIHLRIDWLKLLTNLQIIEST